MNETQIGKRKYNPSTSEMIFGPYRDQYRFARRLLTRALSSCSLVKAPTESRPGKPTSINANASVHSNASTTSNAPFSLSPALSATSPTYWRSFVNYALVFMLVFVLGISVCLLWHQRKKAGSKTAFPQEKSQCVQSLDSNLEDENRYKTHLVIQKDFWRTVDELQQSQVRVVEKLEAICEIQRQLQSSSLEYRKQATHYRLRYEELQQQLQKLVPP